jgi:parallel beta-helix repeat protein
MSKRSLATGLVGFFAALVALTGSEAAEIYVASSGVEGSAGSCVAPLASFAEAAAYAREGDTILLERGGTYVGSDAVVGRGVEVTAYGAGADPIMTGSVVVATPGTWAQNPAVRTGAVAARVVACYVDGRFVPRARYPNVSDGFLRNDNDNEPNRIVDADLALRPGVATGRWTGAQVRWRKWSWWWETRPIASHSPVTTLDLAADGDVGINLADPGSGYFIDGDLDELDAPGEWHWAGGVLYLYPPAWADPGTVEVSVVTTTSSDPLVPHDDEPAGVSSNGGTFSHLHFTRYYGTALRIGGPSTVEDCTFSEIESTAIRFTWDAQPFTIRRSVFRDVRNVAIQGWADLADPAGSLIERNLFLRIGVEPGYGGNGPWHAAGVILGRANAAVVRLNRFVDTGYAGIILGSDGQTVERNVFVRAMHTLNDGAAIYANCNASIIRENIILDTIGDLEYSHPWWPLGHGIWPEFLEEFHDTQITDNTVYGSNGHGLFLPNNYHCTISGNTFADNRLAAVGLYRYNDNAGFDPNQNHTLTGNILAAVVPTRRIQRPENLNQWWLPPYTPPVPVALEYDTTVDFGTMSSTTFIAPASDAGVFRVEPYGGGSSYMLDTLGAWSADAPSWADATGSLINRSHAFVMVNDTESVATMAVPAGSWTRPDGSAVGATIIIQPFRSQVLVSATPTPATPPYRAASGINWRADTPTSSYLGGSEVFGDDFESGTSDFWSAVIGD